MKEYISLEWFEGFLVSQNIAWDGTDIPTVTKADICRELCESVIHSLEYLANDCKEAGYDEDIKGNDCSAIKYREKEEAYLFSIGVIKEKCKLAEMEGE